MAKLTETVFWPKHRWSRIGIIAAIGAVLLTAVLIALNRPALPALAEMNIAASNRSFTPIAQGEAWNPRKADFEDGFAVVAENGHFKLLIDPKWSQIAVKEKSTGYMWRSNPAKEQLAEEKVKGLQLSNLESPYILEYVSEGKTQRDMTNALEDKADIRFLQIDKGIQVTYSYAKLNLSLAIQYQLTEHGLEVTVPDKGIREEGENKFFSVNLLPFFGAVSGTSEEGYLFVPDGPGGLIRYNSNRPSVGNRYDYPVYDYDPALLQEKPVPREPISYPVFGLKRGDHAYAAILKDGKYSAWIQALPAGVQSIFNSISARYTYREEFLRKTSRLSPPVNSVQKQRIHQDCRVEYRLLSGIEANYAGMAHAYRDELTESGQLPPLMRPVEHVPLQLAIIGGGNKSVFGGRSFVKATTFEQAERMAGTLTDRGVQNMQIIYYGWQSSGHIHSDRHFPVRKELGGVNGAKRFVDAMHAKGIKVLFGDDIISRDPGYSDQTARTDAVRGIDSTVYFKKTRFLLQPETAVRSEKRVVDRLKELGVDGIQYDGMALLFRDFNPDRPLQREDAVQLYQGLLAYTKHTLGMASADRGNDYLLSSASSISHLSVESSYDYIVDETVPFYPMAVHGSIPYASVEGNLRSGDDQFLRAIEYGAVPAFKLTYDRSRVLKGTDYDDLYSSDFELWVDRVVDEYNKFNRLASVYNRQMVNHEKIADGIYVTTYDDGTKVTVNYQTKQFDVVKGGRDR